MLAPHRFLVSCSLLACDLGDHGALRSENDDPQVAAAEDAPDGDVPESITATRAMPLAAAGWIDHEDSPITPWCGAVLIAPDVAITAAICVDGWDHRYIDVGFGPVGTQRHAVDEIVIQGDAVTRDHALAALHLAEPVVGVEPAELQPRDRDACGVHSVAYLYVVRGDESSRSLWSGCTSAGNVMAGSGAPNCHGDMGTGGFLADGSLVGVAVDSWFRADVDGDPLTGCADGHRLATVADNTAFFDSALDLSQPAA